MCNKCAETELLGVAVPEMTEQLLKDKSGRAGKMFYYPDKWCKEKFDIIYTVCIW